MEMRKKHLKGPEYMFWENELRENLPGTENLKILDIGTGSGFLTIIAAGLGHRTTGIDVSPEMIRLARENADRYPFCDRIRFELANGEELSYPDESFDVVISQFTIWTSIDATRIFREVFRVLKPGGIFLFYDIDFGSAVSVREGQSPDYRKLMEECDAYKALLPISHVKRPHWDVETLRNTGFVHCECRRNMSTKLNPHGAKRQAQSPVFAIYAVKPDSVANLPFSEEFLYFHRHNQLFYRENRLFGDKQDTQYLILELIIRQPEGLRSSDIMEYFYIPKQTLTRMIAALTAEGLIIQKKNPRDSRSILLFITRKGYEFYRDQTMTVLENTARILQKFPAEKMKLMNELYMEYLNALIEIDDLPQ